MSFTKVSDRDFSKYPHPLDGKESLLDKLDHRKKIMKIFSILFSIIMEYGRNLKQLHHDIVIEQHTFLAQMVLNILH